GPGSELQPALAAIALTSAAVSGLPPIAQSPLSISCTRTHVTGRIASPSTATMASVTLWIIWFFWSGVNTTLMSWISTSGICGLLQSGDRNWSVGHPCTDRNDGDQFSN